MASGDNAIYSSKMYANKSFTSFKWNLEDYSMLEHFYGKGVNSPEFEISQTDKKCSLSFEHENADAFATVNFPTAVPFHTLRIDVSIIDECDRKIVAKTTIINPPISSTLEYERSGYVTIPASDLFTKKGCLHNDTLTLLCEITIITSVNKSSIDTATQGRCLDDKVCEKFEEFYIGERFCDVTLSFGRRKLLAHKVVLAASSPVFEAMFKTEMMESADNTVVITDIEPPTFNAFLKSVYTASISKVEEYVDEILIIANKYQVLTIQNLCEKYINNHLNGANVIQYLKLAHSHGFNNLKKRALAVAVKYRKEIIDCPDFETLCDYRELVTEIFQKVTESETKVIDTDN